MANKPENHAIDATKLDANIVKAFKTRYQKEQQRAKAYEDHCAHYDTDIKKLMGDLKVDIGGDLRDINLWYKLWSRQQDAMQMDEDDRDRILATNRIMFYGLDRGEMLDWMEVADATEHPPSPAMITASHAGDANAEEEEAEASAEL